MHPEYQSHSEDYFSSEHSEIEDEHLWGQLPVQQVESKSLILHWTVDDVKTWLQENVPFGHDRMQGLFFLLLIVDAANRIGMWT